MLEGRLKDISSELGVSFAAANTKRGLSGHRGCLLLYVFHCPTETVFF